MLLSHTAVVQASSVNPLVEVVVRDIADRSLLVETEHAIQNVLRTHPLGGRWMVTVAKSNTRGRWDVAVKEQRHTHHTTFSSPTECVPALAAQHVERALFAAFKRNWQLT